MIILFGEKTDIVKFGPSYLLNKDTLSKTDLTGGSDAVFLLTSPLLFTCKSPPPHCTQNLHIKLPHVPKLSYQTPSSPRGKFGYLKN